MKMAPSHRSTTIATAALALMLLALLSDAQIEPPPAAGAPEPAAEDCMMTLVLGAVDCLTYVEAGSNLTRPDKPCCGELKRLVDTRPDCLCQMMEQNNSFGIDWDFNKVMNLASICNISTRTPTFCPLFGSTGISVGSPAPPAPPPRPPPPPLPPSVVGVPVPVPAPIPVQDGASSGALGKPGPHKKPGGGHPSAIISVSSVGVLFLLLTLAFWIYLHKKKVKRELEDICDLTAESLQMELHTIRVATQNFSADRKLGKGGFGEVYKGTLENGHEIAVKRLSRDSGQGLAEFKTEVLIVAKLQHRNLVKLLGFCASGKEKVLVYEYLPNSSLDKFLFDPIKRLSLNWEMRFKIISGIAKGLLYLHEDSRLKIIHRDLKTSNILLDEAMNPKIADFGLAKLFSVDQTQDATNTVIGTYGYMAPEYMLTGQYSVKSDVYAFGIIVLEVVSGQRNKYLNRPQHEEAILHRAWRLWTEGEPMNLVDETLGENYSVEDVMKCIHVAFMCIQENIGRRPSVRTVVSALGGETINLPSLTPPNFLATTDPVSGENTSASGSEQGQVSVYIHSDITLLNPR